ncbi:MAG TPA: tetratricopeptide repeat protein, partial [Rhabdochlamydiaceae bacterium]
YLQTFERQRTQELFTALHEATCADASLDRCLEIAQTARAAGYYDAATEILAAISQQAARMELDYKMSLQLKRELAQLYGEKHEYKLALPLCEEIVSLIELNEGESEELFNALIDLSTVVHGIGDYDRAERAIRHALEFEEVAPVSRRLDAEQNLATHVLAQGHYEDAVKLHEQTLDLSIRLLGKMHPSSLAYSGNLAAAMIFARQFTKALEVLETTLPAIKSILGSKHALYLGGLENLGRIYKELGHFESAETIYHELISLMDLLNGPMSEKAIIFQLGLGKIYYIKGEPQKAFEVYRKYLPALSDLRGTTHPSVLRSHKTMNDILIALKMEQSD